MLLIREAVDAMIPICHGQREVIISDRQTGKTAIAKELLDELSQTYNKRRQQAITDELADITPNS